MSLICAISNETPEIPVISPVSGCIYERRLIEKYIRENGTDPLNGEKLSLEALIDVKSPPLVKPRPPTATSIPAILKLLQDEWDAVMLNNYALRQQLQTARQELSHTLYQHDAACRVIARLTKEVTAAREALATLKPQTTMTGVPINPQGGYTDAPPAPMETSQDVVGMSDEIVLKLQEKASLLTAERKKRGKLPPENLTGVDEIKNFKQIASHVGLHSASMPGILCLDICLRDSAKIVTGGMDKNAVVFNKNTESVVAILQGHTKKVTNVIYHPSEELVLTSSLDATIRVWGVQKTAPCAHVIRAHEAPVTGLSLHATGDYVLSSSTDGYWAFSDIRHGRVLTKVSEAGAQAPAGQGMTCAKFHPDGLIFGTGTDDSIIKIWDLKENTNVANFTGHQGAISSLAFSENGYYLATAADDGVVKLWDLRKLKNFKNITLEDRYEIKSLAFDQSGNYLVVTGTDIKLYLCKQWQELKVFNDHTALATDACFGSNASFLASVSMDRTLKIFSQ